MYQVIKKIVVASQLVSHDAIRIVGYGATERVSSPLSPSKNYTLTPSVVLASILQASQNINSR